MDKEIIIADIQRVAAAMQGRSLSRSIYKEQGRISNTAVSAAFGSWNEAVKEAGLVPLPQGGLPKSEGKRTFRLSNSHTQAQSLPETISDEEALRDLIRLTLAIGRRPSGDQISSKGNYSKGLYQKRWGSVAAACEDAYAKYGNPLAGKQSV